MLRSEASRKKAKLSDELRQERERLFKEPKRYRKNNLPFSKKTPKDRERKVTTKMIIDESLYIMSLLWNEADKLGVSCEWITLDNLKLDNESAVDRYCRNWKRDNPLITKVDLKKNLTFYRTMVCFMLYHCYGFQPQTVAEFYGVHRDFTGTANRVLVPTFQTNRKAERAFLDIFDSLMIKNEREYL
jgi:hypothetical protein